MRKKVDVEKRKFTDTDGRVVFEYPHLSGQGTEQVLQALIDCYVDVMEHCDCEDMRENKQVELLVLANCRDWLHTYRLAHGDEMEGAR